MAPGSDSKPLSYYLSKIRQGQDAAWDKDELLDVIYWWRQGLCIAMGILWGVVPLTGLMGFLSFLVVNMLLTAVLYKSLLGVDEEDYGGHNELLAEGMPPSVPCFLLVWVLTFSVLHA